MRLFFTMVQRGDGSWQRVGPVYRSAEVAKSWLPFVRKAWHSPRARVQSVTVKRGRRGQIAERLKRRLSEEFNVDAN